MSSDLSELLLDMPRRLESYNVHMNNGCNNAPAVIHITCLQAIKIHTNLQTSL